MKPLLWFLILAACLMSVIILGFHSMIAEVDMREEKVKHRRAYNQWLCDRALNEHITQKEWTR